MWPEIPPFPEAIALALQDASARRHLESRLARLDEARRAAWTAPEAVDLRRRLTDLRAQTVASLADFLAQAEAQARARGIHVHWAETAAEARDLVLARLADAAAEPLLIGRTPPLEEIRLVPELEARGHPTTLLDAGGLIARTVGDAPSHPTAALAHLSDRDLTDLWREYTGQGGTYTVADVLQAAHARVQRALQKATILVSGCHVLVAETGTPVLFDPEGPLALACRRARRVILVVGLEQVTPRLADVPLLAATWARAALGTTAPPLTVFLHPHARREVHLVFVDNGRTRLWEAGFTDLLRCIHCGACVTACPVVRLIGGQPFAGPYMGPLAATWAAVAWPDRHGTMALASTLCGACTLACPAGIDLHGYIAQARERLSRQQGWRAFWESGRQRLRQLLRKTTNVP